MSDTTTFSDRVGECPMVDFGLGDGPQACEILGVHGEGVKVRTYTMAPEGWLVVPAAWISGYRPQDHPELVQRVNPQMKEWRLTENQHAVLKALAAAGLNGMIDDDHELVNNLGRDTAGKRRLELLRKGFVEATERRRPTRRGQPAVVYVINRAGKAALVQHDNALVAV